MNVWLYVGFSNSVVTSTEKLNSNSDKTEKFVSEPLSSCKLPISRATSFSPEKQSNSELKGVISNIYFNIGFLF